MKPLIPTIVSFQNDAGAAELEAAVAAFLRRWAETRPHHHIKHITAHLPCNVANGAYAAKVRYTFFYIDESPDGSPYR